MPTTGQLGTPLSAPGLVALGGTAPTTLTLVMRGLAGLLEASGLVRNVYDFPAEAVTTPAGVVGYPTSIDFDQVFARGKDLYRLPFWVLVGKTGTADARDAVSDVLSDAGSVKALLDGNHDFNCVRGDVSVRVLSAEVAEVNVSGVANLGVKFDCEVYA